jgi:hypothetical protein
MKQVFILFYIRLNCRDWRKKIKKMH